MTLTEGQFICSAESNYFAGIHDSQFGVFAGTPAAPLGTSIILSDASAKVAMLADGRLVSYANAADEQPNWSTPTVDGPGFAVMQSDGNLCVYASAGPDDHGAFMFGSLQNGGLVANFLPYHRYATSQVTVRSFITGQFNWCVMKADGANGTEGPRVHQDPSGGRSSTATGSVSGQAGCQCWLRAFDAWGKTHDSGDNFSIGDPDVRYSANFAWNPMVLLDWSRHN